MVNAAKLKSYKEYSIADDEAYQVLSSVIESVSDHACLKDYTPLMLFFNKAKHCKGAEILASIRPFKPKEQLWHDYNYVIEIYFPFWRDNPDKRKALIDHELCHLIKVESEEKGTFLATRGHDIEEFYGVIQRHGDWLGEVSILQARQLEFGFSRLNGQGS